MNDPPHDEGQQAPSVKRALRVLTYLADADEPRTLSALSRDLGVGGSTLLTILAPLRSAGAVVRDDCGGYSLGPTLAGLGEAAIRACTPARLFERIAEPLARQTGETVVLWTACGSDLVLAAYRAGTQPLRFVPSVGLRVAVHGSALGDLKDGGHPIEQELLPSVWMIATTLPSSDDASAAVAVVGPAERLRGRSGEAARSALSDAIATVPGAFGSSLAQVAPATGQTGTTPAMRPRASRKAPDSRSAADSAGIGATPLAASGGARSGGAHRVDWQYAGPIDPIELDAFLGEGHVATLSYVADDGYPATVPLWYAWDGAAIWLAPRPGSEWAAHVRVDPRVSLAVSESVPPLRRVLVRGRVEPVESPDGVLPRRVATELAGRYAGCGTIQQHDAPLREQLLCLRPERLIAWRGLLRHPRSDGAAPPTNRPGERQLG